MYFITFDVKGQQSIGVLTEDKKNVVKLSLYKDMLEFIASGETGLLYAKHTIANIKSNAEVFAIEQVVIKAPLPRPSKNIFCIGKNYADHVKELGNMTSISADIPTSPVVFTKASTTVIGPNDNILSHADVTKALDYEVELAVIIGKDGINISKEAALDHVFGYTILNDVSARDLQQKHIQWFKGKSLDTFCPMGPYLVHKSAVKDVTNLDIKSKINGEIRQNSNTKNFIFDIPTIIEALSAGMTLEAGDIIATGTPAGVGMGFTPPRLLKAGDEIELSITGLGVLKNTVI